MRRWPLSLLLLLVLTLLAAGCAQQKMMRNTPDGKFVYNRFTIHTFRDSSKDLVASYANYTDPAITVPNIEHKTFPPNTHFRVEKWNRGFKLIQAETGEVIYYEYSPKRTQMDVLPYMDLVFSPTPVSLDGLTELDKQGLKAGKAMKGMTKPGVMAALGYPSPHSTLSLDADKWVYWTNRFGTRAIFFENGLVVSVSGQ
ncbi:hypothetical protein [Desulfocurvibacter africanus]|uniref:Lipoprotein n=1 Tax=Desulfocurvibacter africanus subsp. africanus str. Walvis Bay TaxID=690850 RepID=F3YY41_DESAF|nr:hypothetical protein [Desulfocurvibacter africanus]EGJ51817.1 hypothetical protein Desaf_3536 [Desulfocurvibacter africanus subsp. africanus str. Walvis Bay]